MRQIRAKINSKKIKNKKFSRDVVPLQAHVFQKSVTTIGFQVPGLIAGEKLKDPFPHLKETLGGKAAGLVEMVRIRIPAPPSFNLGTFLCSVYLMKQKLPDVVLKQFRMAIAGLENKLGKKFGDKKNPLLVSVRSGARVSMPGMMDTILNIGLNRDIVEALALQYPERSRFWWDCYRRLIQMFSNVVLDFESHLFEKIVDKWKTKEGVRGDAELSEKALQNRLFLNGVMF